MFRAFGLIILIWFLTRLFNEASVAFEDATVASFQFVETAAVVSTTELKSRSQ